jgi:hypothetical protein
LDPSSLRRRKINHPCRQSRSFVQPTPAAAAASRRNDGPIKFALVESQASYARFGKCKEAALRLVLKGAAAAWPSTAFAMAFFLSTHSSSSSLPIRSFLLFPFRLLFSALLALPSHGLLTPVQRAAAVGSRPFWPTFLPAAGQRRRQLQRNKPADRVHCVGGG